MSKIVIVYHSGYGHTKKVAEAVAQGSGGELLAIDAEGNLPEGGWDKLNAAQAIVFGTPTYMGSVSWQFKKFADASSKPWYTQAWTGPIPACSSPCCQRCRSSRPSCSASHNGCSSAVMCKTPWSG